MLFDCHCHLGEASSAELFSWRAAGVAGLVDASTIPAEWPGVLKRSALSLPDMLIVPALGIHPWQAANQALGAEALVTLETLLQEHPQAVLGEIGVDYKVDVPADLQEYLFRQQVTLALKYHRPAVLHLRGNWQRTCQILEEFPALTGVVHGFSGSSQVAEWIINHTRLHISIGPALLKATARRVANAAATIPLERLLCDSDYPWMHCTPQQCSAIIQALANCRKEEQPLLLRQIMNNWRRLFILPSA